MTLHVIKPGMLGMFLGRKRVDNNSGVREAALLFIVNWLRIAVTDPSVVKIVS